MAARTRGGTLPSAFLGHAREAEGAFSDGLVAVGLDGQDLIGLCPTSARHPSGTSTNVDTGRERRAPTSRRDRPSVVFAAAVLEEA